MKYINDYLQLKDILDADNLKAEFDNIEILKFKFQSSSFNILPGNNSDYYCSNHNLNFKNSISNYNEIGTIQNDVYIKDFFVEENKVFPYRILTPKNNNLIKKVTFIFHGFNEKDWDKYLPWGKAICERTQSAVVFFPIAFHMERAPVYWSEKRKMFELSQIRKQRFPNIINSSLSNVAISMRLHSMPQRFIWSGLQTYYDVIQFIEYCKAGNHPIINKDFSFDIFAYSIGGLLAQILKLSNYKNYFDQTKVCLFCSGAVFNRLSPVSKFILDSEANVILYSYLVEHFDSYLKKDPLLNHYISENHFEGKVFHAMLDYKKMRVFREDLLRKSENQFYAISLKKDTVIPTFEIMNTLQGAFRNINITVDEIDFDYNYTHENPFTMDYKKSEKVDLGFNQVFDKVGLFLTN